MGHDLGGFPTSISNEVNELEKKLLQIEVNHWRDVYRQLYKAIWFSNDEEVEYTKEAVEEARTEAYLGSKAKVKLETIKQNLKTIEDARDFCLWLTEELGVNLNEY